MQRSILCVLGMFMGVAGANTGPFTLTWGAQESGSCLCLANGEPLSAGQKVRIGYFDISQQEIKLHSSQPSLLAAHFHVLSEAGIGSFEGQTFVGFPELSTSGISIPEALGSFASSIIFTPSSEASEMDGKRCYVWAMNGATVDASSQHGIFSHSSWVLDLNSFGSGQWDLSQVSAANPGDVLLGTRGPQISAQVGGPVLRMMNTSQMLADQADDDHDGAPGLLEAAFAMNPATPDSSKLPQITLRHGSPCLEFQRRSGGLTSQDSAYTAGDLRYFVETSANLQQWLPYDTSGPGILSALPGSSPGMEAISIQLNAGTGAASAQFARVRIERIP